LIVVLGLYALTNQWKIINIDFPEEILKISIPAYTLIWMISILFNGGYDSVGKFLIYLKGTVIGTLFILIVYGLLPKDWQFSRLYILIGAAWVVLYFILSRLFLHVAIGGRFNIFPVKNKNLQL
jgi:O-antigen biosynthesis protein